MDHRSNDGITSQGGNRNRGSLPLQAESNKLQRLPAGATRSDGVPNFSPECLSLGGESVEEWREDSGKTANGEARHSSEAWKSESWSMNITAYF